MLTQAIQSKVDQLWDRFWSGGIANPLSAIEQISYLLFMRRLDAMDQKKKEEIGNRTLEVLDLQGAVLCPRTLIAGG